MLQSGKSAAIYSCEKKQGFKVLKVNPRKYRIIFDMIQDIGLTLSAMEHDDETGSKHSKKEPPLPTIGLEFDSFDEAYDFYNIYAKEQGFGIRVSNSWFRTKKKERYRAKLSCSSAGFKKKSEANNPRPETRTGCPAMVVIRLVDSKRWRIVEVELEHNHQVSPQIKRFYKSHKKMILAARKARLPTEPVTEIHTIKLYRTAAMDAVSNGFSNVSEREGIHQPDHSKHLELKEGDAYAVYNFFCRMKLTNPNFFYLMDFDDDGPLKNVFWADARAWLKCMLGHQPQVIVTDQCKSLQIAVSEVFPKARHCFCLWYIMQRVPEKLGGLRGFEEIKRQLNKAVYNSLKIIEFETSWTEMIKKHGLGDNKWLQTLYEERKQWVPVYLKDTFFSGMIPIRENESLNAFFDGYVHKHTSFKEFVDKYDLALYRKHLKEATADVQSKNSSFELKTRCNFEVQLSKAYTKEIFDKFQSEVEGMYSCFNTRQVTANGPIITYIVKERVEIEGNEKEVRSYEVLFETNQVDIRCICSLFNYKGYLCRHALNVLNYNGVEEVPSRYILRRWCKDFKFQHVDLGSTDIDVYGPVYRQSHFHNCAVPIVEGGAQSEEQQIPGLLCRS
ncbi:hypothetical protein GOBAR_DD03405 [Gossypium barbadense]|nr:hypothetical protein GOBAR_DD03405 [Gossypium barbadense]